jgi:hypothetical protein
MSSQGGRLANDERSPAPPTISHPTGAFYHARGGCSVRAAAGETVAANTGVRRLYALTHPDHSASWRVLEKCAFEREGLLRGHTEFPNLHPGEPSDVLCYARILNR